MSFITEWTERLQATRLSLQDNTFINDPENYDIETGMLDFILNPAFNPVTIQAEQTRQSTMGEFRDVQIRYKTRRGTENVITTDASLNCDGEDQVRDKLTTVQPTLFVSDKFSLHEDYVRENNELGLNGETRLTQGLREIMRTCRESMSSQLLSKAAGLFGANPARSVGAGAYHSFQAINSSGENDVANFDVIKNDRDDNHMRGPVALIGFGGVPRRYQNRLAVGNMNAQTIDVMEVARAFNQVFFREASSETNLGNANRLLALYPGLTQFFSYNLNRGYFAKETPDSLIKGVLPDPIYPIVWDYDISYNRQCSENGGRQGSWDVRVMLSFDLFTTPEDAFGDTYSDINGFNGILGYELTTAE